MINEKYLSVVIVNYINFSLTEKCIASVIDNYNKKNYEIIVIDNNSPNNSYKELSKKYRGIENIKIIKNDKNAGFGAANNLGAKLAKGKYILFLNPDVIVIDDAIDKMLKAIEQNKDLGLVSCKLLNEDYSVQYSCRRILPFTNFLKCRTPISKLVSNEKIKELVDLYLMRDFDHNSDLEVDWVMGACMLMNKDEFLSLDGFSKEYFMYFEDVDLCCKVRKKGKKVFYLAKAKMVHLHKQESSKKINKMSIIHLKSMIKFYIKYYSDKL